MDIIKTARPRQKVLYEWVMVAAAWATLFASLFVLATTITMRIMNSDSLYVEDLAHDLFVMGGYWSDWSLPPATGYVPDMLLYFVGYFLFNGAEAHIIFVTVCQGLLLAFAVLFLARRISPSLSIGARAGIVMLVALPTLVASYSAMMLYFNRTNWHVSSLLFSLVCTGLLLDFLEFRRRRTALFIILSIAASQVSDAIFCISFLLPAGAALGGALIGTYVMPAMRKWRRVLVQSLVVLFAGEMLSKVIEKLLTFNNSLNGDRIPITVKAAQNSWHQFIGATNAAFGWGNKITLGYSIFALLTFLFLLSKIVAVVRFYRASRPAALALFREEWRLYITFAFFCIVLPANFFGAILSGGFVDPYGYRYFTFPLALIFLLTVLLLDRHRQPLPQWLLGTLALAACLAPILTIVSFERTVASGVYQTIVSPVEQSQEAKTARCLTDLQKKGVDFHAGISEFWLARGVSELWPTHNPILVYNADTSPLFWMSTMGPIRRPENYKRYYNFAILPEPAPFLPEGMDTETFGKKMPAGYKRYYCAPAKAQILVYPGNALDAWVTLTGQRFLFRNGIGTRALFFASDLPGIVGEAHGTHRVASAPSDKEGYLSYGPYARLKQGRYKITLTYMATPGSTNYWDIVGDARHLHSRSLFKAPLPTTDHVVTTILTVPNHGMKHLEVRSYFSGRGHLTVDSVEIVKLQD